VTRRPRLGRGPRSVRGGGRVHPAAALVLVAALAAVIWAMPPTAQAADSCDGVWVVVDFSAFGGGVQTRCAPGAPRNGLDALERARFSYGFVAEQPGMVCTIDANPDPCNGAPSDAYWSYWHAPQGGSWTYSSSGAGFRRPPPGTVDGWVFGDGSSPPSVAPPKDPPPPEPSPSPSPSPTATSSPAPSPSPTATAAPEPVEDGPTPSATTAPDPIDDASADTRPEPDDAVADAEDPTLEQAPEEDAAPSETAAPRQARPSPTPRPTAQGSGELPPVELRDADDEVAIGRPGDGGATAGLIAGTALAAAIAGAGVFQGRRRRLASEHPELPGIEP
jgi:hypothetical protein